MGVTDYEKAIEDEEYVIVKVQNPDGEDMYIGFNRAAGINANMATTPNKVMVHTRRDDTSSNLVFNGNSGSSYSFDNFGGSGHSLVIQVNGIDTSELVWKASVTTYLSNCSPTDCSTNNPSSSPSSQLSSHPSEHFSMNPTLMPFKNPSESPSAQPS